MVFPRGGGACIRYDEIRSMSGWYASYWNAFLFCLWICNTGRIEIEVLTKLPYLFL